MTKQKRSDPLIVALQQQIPYSITAADGGNFASMRQAIKHGQALTFSPVTDPALIRVGDIVLVSWRGGSIIMHLVGDIRDGQFLIINSLGKENGWVTVDAILGYVTYISEPVARPTVPEMLDQLERAYQAVLAQSHPSAEETARLLAVAADLRWYATAIESTQWHQLPRPNLWSFEQHLWHLTKEAQQRVTEVQPDLLPTLIHHGKEHVGQVAICATLLAATKQAFMVKHGNDQSSIRIRNVIPSQDLVPLVNLRNHCAGPGAQPITLVQQTAKLSEPNQHPATDHWVAHKIDDSWTILGQSFGYHTIPERYLAWVEVHPDWRRRGLGSELLKRVLARAKALGADHLLIYAAENATPAHAFLQRHEFQAKSDSWVLRASDDVLVTLPQWPQGYTVRIFAEVQDLGLLGRVCTESYGDLWGHGENSPSQRTKPPEATGIQWLSADFPHGENIFLVFDEGDNIAGICRGFVGQQQGQGRPTGEIDGPGVMPAYRHLRLQRPLIQTVMQWLRSQGHGPVYLHSFGDSAATVELYRELGFTLERHLLAYHLDIVR